MTPKLIVAIILTGIPVACGGKLAPDERTSDPVSIPPTAQVPAPRKEPSKPAPPTNPTQTTHGLACLTPAECPDSRPSCCLTPAKEKGELWTSACTTYCGFGVELDVFQLCATDDDCRSDKACKTHHCDDGRTYKFCGEETVHCYGK